MNPKEKEQAIGAVWVKLSDGKYHRVPTYPNLKRNIALMEKGLQDGKFSNMSTEELNKYFSTPEELRQQLKARKENNKNKGEN